MYVGSTFQSLTSRSFSRYKIDTYTYIVPSLGKITSTDVGQTDSTKPGHHIVIPVEPIWAHTGIPVWYSKSGNRIKIRPNAKHLKIVIIIL